VEALGLLLSGKTITETAAALGVARETVSRWRHADAAFEAVYNEGLRSAWEAGHVRLEEARGKAIERLVSLMESDDPAVALKAAMALVRLDIPEPKGSVNPERIQLNNFMGHW
jgi:HEAT repeat protein